MDPPSLFITKRVETIYIIIKKNIPVLIIISYSLIID